MKSFETFEKRYAPISRDGDIIFETYGSDLDTIKRADSKNLWTLLDCDGRLIIASGFHYVNRMGYILTERQWKDEFEEYSY